MNDDDARTESPPLRGPWQFSLWTLLLLSTAIGSLVAFYRLRIQCQQARIELAGLQRVANADESEPWRYFSALLRNGNSHAGFSWVVYLPPTRNYRIAWTSTRQNQNGVVDDSFVPMASAPIPPGEHTITIRCFVEADHWVMQTEINDQAVLKEQLPPKWNPRFTTISPKQNSHGAPLTDGPFVLHDEVFHSQEASLSSDPNSPKSNTGLRVWIEAIEQ